jgi:transcription elongation GreA/GreB family factor
LTKNQVFEQIETELKIKIDETQQEISSLQQEMSEDTKSSAGDKFETSREMMNQSINRLQDSLQQHKKQLQQLQGLKGSKSSEKVNMGSFVSCEKTCFLFGLAFGKVNSTKENIFALSLNSPLGRIFLDKKVGDIVKMNQSNYTIKSIE